MKNVNMKFTWTLEQMEVLASVFGYRHSGTVFFDDGSIKVLFQHKETGDVVTFKSVSHD